MSTQIMKKILQTVKADQPRGESIDIVCDYFDQGGNMKGFINDKHPFEIRVDTTVKRYNPDPKNDPERVEELQVFSVEDGVEKLRAELAKLKQPKPKRGRPAKQEVSKESETVEA